MNQALPGPTEIDPRPAGFRIVVPPQWWRIGLDQPARTRDVERVVRRQFAGLDDQPQARRAVTTELTRRADRAASVGGIELYLSTMRQGDVVLPASLLVTYSPPPQHEPDLQSLADLLCVSDGTSQVRSCQVADLPVGPAVRRLAHLSITEGDPDGDLGTEEIPAIALDWHVPIPMGEGALITLSFSTPIIVLEDALTDLFDTIAATFTWAW